MTKRFILVLAIVGLAAMVSAQSYPQNNPEQPNTSATAPQNATNAPGQVAAGTDVLATLDQKLSTKTSHVGDTFEDVASAYRFLPQIEIGRAHV